MGLENQIRNFMDLDVSAFKFYQIPSFRTSKLHALTHIINTLRDMIGIKYIHRGVYKKPHRTSRMHINGLQNVMKQQWVKELDKVMLDTPAIFSSQNLV